METPKADWKAIETEYITTDISQRDLSKKYGVPLSTITYRSVNGKWVEQRRQHCDKVAARTAERIAEKQATTQANRLLRIVEINDRLLDILEESAEQLTRREVTRKVKTRTIEYNNEERPDKPTKEIIHEDERLEFIEGDVDRAGLKHLAASMKAIADTYLKEREARKEDEDANGVMIRISGVNDAEAEGFSG